MRILLTLAAILTAGLPAFAAPDSAPDREKSPAEVLPATTVVYAEMGDPATVLAAILDGPLRRRIEKLDAYREAFRSKGMLQLAVVVALLEVRLGMGWREALETLTSGGIALGVDGATGGTVLIVRGKDAEALASLRDGALALVEGDAANKGQPSPVRTAEYRGQTTYRIGEAAFATVGRWLVVTNRPALGSSVLDNLLGEPTATLAGTERFEKGRSLLRGRPSVWTWVDTAALRSAGAAPDLFREQAKNPGVELLFGGVLEHLRRAPSVTATLSLSESEVLASVTMPHDPAWTEGPREYFFGPASAGTSPPLLDLPGTVLSVSAHRDVAGMWLNAGDLFDENVNDRMAQAENVLTTLFSGLDFGEDVLGAISPGMQIVATRRAFEEGTARPVIRLPAFAAVVRLREPERMRPRLRRAFQSLIGFLNVQGATEGRPQLDLETERLGETMLVSATPVPEEGMEDTASGPVSLNFSPSIAFFGDRFVLASTRDLARELMGAAAAPDAAGLRSNTAMVLDAAVLRSILEDNRRHLVANNMLKEGRTREEAETAIGALLDLVTMARTATFDLTAGGEVLTMEMRVSLAAAAAPTPREPEPR